MSKNIYFILTFLGFLWGIFGGYIILTGFYASIINYFYFKNYQNEES